MLEPVKQISCKDTQRIVRIHRLEVLTLLATTCGGKGELTRCYLPAFSLLVTALATHCYCQPDHDVWYLRCGKIQNGLL